MRITLGRLRTLIAEALAEGGGASDTYPYIRDAVAPADAEREQIGSLARNSNDEEEEELPPHLREPLEDPEDCRGPIPQGDDDVYAISDPYTNDWSVLPTPRFSR